MMVTRFFRLQGLLLVLALSVALVATGFAHHAPSAQDEALVAYALSGGALDDLCGDDETAAGQDCPACQIVSGTMLPDSVTSIHAADLIFVAKVVAPRASRAVRVVLDPARGMRAPPLA